MDIKQNTNLGKNSFLSYKVVSFANKENFEDDVNVVDFSDDENFEDDVNFIDFSDDATLKETVKAYIEGGKGVRYIDHREINVKTVGRMENLMRGILRADLEDDAVVALDFEHADLRDEHLVAFCNVIRDIRTSDTRSKITKINFSLNYISSKGIRKLSQLIKEGYLTSLSFLSVAVNTSLNQDSIKELCDAIEYFADENRQSITLDIDQFPRGPYYRKPKDVQNKTSYWRCEPSEMPLEGLYSKNESPWEPCGPWKSVSQ